MRLKCRLSTDFAVARFLSPRAAKKPSLFQTCLGSTLEDFLKPPDHRAFGYRFTEEDFSIWVPTALLMERVEAPFSKFLSNSSCLIREHLERRFSCSTTQKASLRNLSAAHQQPWHFPLSLSRFPFNSGGYMRCRRCAPPPKNAHFQ